MAAAETRQRAQPIGSGAHRIDVTYVGDTAVGGCAGRVVGGLGALVVLRQGL
ncbi:hypothetical protein [Streptomyces sp. NPDC096934]|uniref:hypothetical protein n=1 Tax=Streptomyces sp. NPDC096934 TaxID=3155551 RepID=UPI003326B00B